VVERSVLVLTMLVFLNFCFKNSANGLLVYVYFTEYYIFNSIMFHTYFHSQNSEAKSLKTFFNQINPLD